MHISSERSTINSILIGSGELATHISIVATVTNDENTATLIRLILLGRGRNEWGSTRVVADSSKS